MTDLASKINAYLTPARRQAIYKIIMVIGVLAVGVSPAFSTQVSQWMAVITAAGTVGSLILAAIVTRAPQWPVIYSAMAALVAALVGTSLITASQADMALRIIAAVITVAPLLVILARTDTRTIDGSPQAEVILSDPVPDPAYMPSPSTKAGNDVIEYDPGNGDAPTTTTLS